MSRLPCNHKKTARGWKISDVIFVSFPPRHSNSVIFYKARRWWWWWCWWLGGVVSVSRENLMSEQKIFIPLKRWRLFLGGCKSLPLSTTALSGSSGWLFGPGWFGPAGTWQEPPHPRTARSGKKRHLTQEALSNLSPLKSNFSFYFYKQ